jgi:hypothetical protein
VKRIPRIVTVEPRSGYRLSIAFDDGTAGQVDLSHLAGRGVFARWTEETFRAAHVTEAGAVAWDDEIEIGSDTLYLKISGAAIEDVFDLPTHA